MTNISSWARLSTALTKSDSRTGLDIQDIDWPETLLAHRFNHCLFTDVNFHGEDILECHFQHCRFNHCRFDSSKLRECVFDHCVFYEADTEQSCSFKFRQLIATQFLACDLSLANFSRASIFRCEWLRCQVQGANLSYVPAASQMSNKVILSDA